jgi:hypothetical protein
MRYTEEHAYGYTVELWRAGDCLVGFLSASEGLIGDTPTGLLQETHYDPKGGKLSFTAKLSIGMTTVRGREGMERSRDLFRFDGTLKGDRVVGVLTHSCHNDSTRAPQSEKVTLLKLEQDRSPDDEPKTYGAWQEHWKPMLARLGPRW